MEISQLQIRLNAARKNKNENELRILQVVLGELATQKARVNKELNELQVENTIRGILNRNNETLGLMAGHNRIVEEEKLRGENQYLQMLLPATLSLEEIKSILVKENIGVRSTNVGKDIGAAIKHFKQSGLKVLGEDVKRVIELLSKGELS